MSFRLRIDSVETLGAETLISGRLLEGAYFGPQYVRLKDATGNERTTTVLSHGLIDAEGWPVTANHKTELRLCAYATVRDRHEMPCRRSWQRDLAQSGC